MAGTSAPRNSAAARIRAIQGAGSDSHADSRSGSGTTLAGAGSVPSADVSGSAEVVSETLQKLSNDKVKIRVLHSGVGAITESDVLLASASNAIIVGFNVRPERNASAVAEQEKVDVRLHTIIYNLTDEIKKAMTGLLSPVFEDAKLILTQVVYGTSARVDNQDVKPNSGGR